MTARTACPAGLEQGAERERRSLVRTALVALAASVALAAGCGRRKAAPSAKSATAPAYEAAREVVGEIQVYVAHDYSEALPHLVRLFKEKHPNVTVNAKAGDARRLVAEIADGARPDVLMSLGDVEVAPLEAAGLLRGRKDFCFITIGIITARGNPLHVNSLEDLAADRVGSIALGPEDTSIGRYAINLLKDQHVWEAVEKKVTMADRRSDVLTATADGRADVCLAYGAELRRRPPGGAVLRERLQLVTDLTARYCLKIPCPAVSVRGCAAPELADTFIEFLAEDDAQDVLAKQGFLRLRDPCCT